MTGSIKLVVVLLLLWGGLALAQDAPAGPVSNRDAPDWVKAQVRSALERHGSFKGDEWSTVAVDLLRKERLLVVRSIQINCEQIRLSEADILNHCQWSIHGYLSGKVSRIGYVDGSVMGEWVDGAPRLAKAGSFRVLQKKGEPVRWGYLNGKDDCTDQTDFFDSVLYEFQHPKVGAEQRETVRQVQLALENDSRAANSATPPQNMAAIPLDNCPKEVARAYRAHVEAWKKADSAAIESTWTGVVRAGRQYGVGTFRFDSPVGRSRRFSTWYDEDERRREFERIRKSLPPGIG